MCRKKLPTSWQTLTLTLDYLWFSPPPRPPAPPSPASSTLPLHHSNIFPIVLTLGFYEQISDVEMKRDWITAASGIAQQITVYGCKIRASRISLYHACNVKAGDTVLVTTLRMHNHLMTVLTAAYYHLRSFLYVGVLLSLRALETKLLHILLKISTSVQSFAGPVWDRGSCAQY